MHKFLICAYKSQNFAQSQKIFMRSSDRETVTFRNSEGQAQKPTSLRFDLWDFNAQPCLFIDYLLINTASFKMKI